MSKICMTDFYPIIPLADNAPELPEQQGNKTKYWLHIDNRLFLFKIGRPNTGENWAEKVACELCALLGLPHAHYELAVWMNQKGILSETIVPHGGRLVMGNELLAEINSTYPEQQLYKVQDHTFGRIVALLSSPDILLPMNWQPPSDAIQNAVDVFSGYLLLDAWIANQDRHHENWGVIRYGEIYLAPTYDHAASMGQNESDVKRKELLTTRDRGRHISSYIKKARSAIYLNKSEQKPLHTLDAFWQLASKRPESAKLWLQRLGDISPEQCQNVFNKIPPSEISETAIEFAMKLLELNKKRLLEVKP
ncbi:HipA domain-containing protein [Methylobacter tundripaludum SV96]|uniref:HipA domain-containing protein n=2 Tax=Methylobacter tundripaludum TaxID=173365 RepID=G3IW76_METTV|nr:HipA domain-containing protein [Methylobacter tundripaludum SV96]